MADADFGFVPSGEGVGPGFGDMSFSTEPENSSFEVSGDGFGFGTANSDAWFVQGPGEDPGFEMDREKKKKKRRASSPKKTTRAKEVLMECNLRAAKTMVPWSLGS